MKTLHWRALRSPDFLKNKIIKVDKKQIIISKTNRMMLTPLNLSSLDIIARSKLWKMSFTCVNAPTSKQKTCPDDEIWFFIEKCSNAIETIRGITENYLVRTASRISTRDSSRGLSDDWGAFECFLYRAGWQFERRKKSDSLRIRMGHPRITIHKKVILLKVWNSNLSFRSSRSGSPFYSSSKNFLERTLEGLMDRVKSFELLQCKIYTV